MQKKLTELLAAFPYCEKNGSGDPVIERIAFDSRDVSPGTHTTGNVCIADAVADGAAAVIYEGNLPAEAAAALEAAKTVSVRVE